MNGFGMLTETTIHAWSAGLLGLLCLIALFTDIRYGVIPNKLNGSFCLLGIGFQALMAGWSGFQLALIGAVASFVAVWLLYLCGAVGAGDVKLFAAIGSIVGVYHGLWVLVYSILLAGIVALSVILYRGITQAMKRTQILSMQMILSAPASEKMTRFPFMVAVFPAVLIYLWGQFG